jgi:hypothetical protein
VCSEPQDRLTYFTECIPASSAAKIETKLPGGLLSALNPIYLDAQVCQVDESAQFDYSMLLFRQPPQWTRVFSMPCCRFLRISTEIHTAGHMHTDGKPRRPWILLARYLLVSELRICPADICPCPFAASRRHHWCRRKGRRIHVGCHGKQQHDHQGRCPLPQGQEEAYHHATDSMSHSDAIDKL